MKSAEAFPGAAFWREAFTLRGSATIRVLPRTLVFAAFAAVLAVLLRSHPWLALPLDVMEVSGLVLGLLLVFRTAAGYERWWEARKLWGEILNQSRNLSVAAVAYGPVDRAWRNELVSWVAAFGHVARGTLREQRRLPEVAALVGAVEGERVANAEHMPSYVAHRIAVLLRRACDDHGLDRFAFLQMDRERAALLDHMGGCERILRTPIPTIYSVTIRRFVVLYLCALPFALAAPLGLMSPAYAIFVAYPILSLEQIGAELQNPFVISSLSHLDLEQLSMTLERNVRAAAGELDVVEAVVPAGVVAPPNAQPPRGGASEALA